MTEETPQTYSAYSTKKRLSEKADRIAAGNRAFRVALDEMIGEAVALAEQCDAAVSLGMVALSQDDFIEKIQRLRPEVTVESLVEAHRRIEVNSDLSREIEELRRERDAALATMEKMQSDWEAHMRGVAELRSQARWAIKDGEELLRDALSTLPEDAKGLRIRIETFLTLIPTAGP